MNNHNIAVGMIVLCDFNKSEKRVLRKIQRKFIRKLTLKKNYSSQTIEELNQIFNEKHIKELAKEQFKPEMWKKRPVLIIHLYERKRMTDSVIVLPLTSVKPEDARNRKSMVFWESEKKPKIMRQDNSWIICDMPYHVSANRLQNYDADVFIDRETYKLVIRKYKKAIADDIPTLP